MHKRSKMNNEATEDKELLFLTSLLNEIHTEYFNSTGDVSVILQKKKNIFSGLVFWTSNPDLKNKVLSHGGQVTEKMNECTYVVVHEMQDGMIDLFIENKCVVLKDKYIYECVYRLSKESVDKYILYDFSEDDDLLNELIGE